MGRSGLQRELTKNQKVEAAINNEAITRQRVEKLESGMKSTQRRFELHDERILVLELIPFRSLWGRLRWLVRGR